MRLSGVVQKQQQRNQPLPAAARTDVLLSGAPSRSASSSVDSLVIAVWQVDGDDTHL